MHFLFNTTFTVEDTLRAGWLNWMRDTYVPAMREASGVADHQLYAIDGTQTLGSQNYSSQWRCDSIAQLGALRAASARLCQDMMETHGEHCLAFSTLMRGLTID
ncbi:MAG: DUF4286 family protein [Marinilabiliaceae bacterium]